MRWHDVNEACITCPKALHGHAFVIEPDGAHGQSRRLVDLRQARITGVLERHRAPGPQELHECGIEELRASTDNDAFGIGFEAPRLAESARDCAAQTQGALGRLGAVKLLVGFDRQDTSQGPSPHARDHGGIDINTREVENRSAR